MKIRKITLSFYSKNFINGDGQQFHQYQQSEQSSLAFTEHKKDHPI
jgi:hypothetical protein